MVAHMLANAHNLGKKDQCAYFGERRGGGEALGSVTFKVLEVEHTSGKREPFNTGEKIDTLTSPTNSDKIIFSSNVAVAESVRASYSCHDESQQSWSDVGSNPEAGKVKLGGRHVESMRFPVTSRKKEVCTTAHFTIPPHPSLFEEQPSRWDYKGTGPTDRTGPDQTRNWTIKAAQIGQSGPAGHSVPQDF